MNKFDFEAVSEAKREMEKLKKSINPLAAVLLLADYPHPELEQAISKLHSKHIDRMHLRFNIVFQLLQNQKSKFYRPKDDFYSDIENRYDKIYCDFKEVMKILGKSKGTVETLIAKKRIIVIQNKAGEKRSFVRSEIIKYAQGL